MKATAIYIENEENGDTEHREKCPVVGENWGNFEHLVSEVTHPIVRT